MKITFVLPCRDLSGGIKVVAVYGNLLREFGHDVTVVHSTELQKRPSRKQRVRRAVTDFITGRTFRRASEKDHLNFFTGRVVPVPRVADETIGDGDAVVATAWQTAEWVSDLSPSKGKKIYLIQGYETMFGDSERVDATWRLPLQKVVISRWLLDLAAGRFGDKTAVHIPNGVDPNQFHRVGGHRLNPPTVGVYYSPSPWKGFDAAVKVLKNALGEFPNLRVMTFGAETPPALLGEHHAHFARPEQENIREIYSECDVWLCCSRLEGFHLPPLEAMACGCPVVSTRVGGPADCVVEGVTGLLSEVDDVEGLTKNLLSLLRESDKIKQMSVESLKRSREFDWRSSARRLEEVLSGNTGND